MQCKRQSTSNYITIFIHFLFFQIKNPGSSTFYTNRALCYLKQKKWPQAITDCQHAIEIDGKSVKGHFFLAQAYLEHQLYDEAIANFTQGTIYIVFFFQYSVFTFRKLSFIYIISITQYKGKCQQRKGKSSLIFYPLANQIQPVYDLLPFFQFFQFQPILTTFELKHIFLYAFIALLFAVCL